MRRLMLIVLMLVVSVSAAMALSERDLVDVTRKLVDANDQKRYSFQFSVDGAQELNACAYPSGKILVTRGMLLALDRQDQLAFVMGHEMTHVVEQHAIGQLKKSGWGLVIGFVVGHLIGNDADSRKTGAQVGAALFGAQRSQKDEYSADTGGCKLAAKAGFDPEGAVEAMQLLQRRYGNGQAGIPVLGWFASHPPTDKRVANLKVVSASLPKRESPAAKPEDDGVAGNSAPSFEGSGLSNEAQDSLRRLIERQRAKQREAEQQEAEQQARATSEAAPAPAQTAAATSEAPANVAAPVSTAPAQTAPAGETWLWGDKFSTFTPLLPAGARLIRYELVGSDGKIFIALSGKKGLSLRAANVAGHGDVVIRYTVLDAEGVVLSSGEQKVVCKDVSPG